MVDLRVNFSPIYIIENFDQLFYKTQPNYFYKHISLLWVLTFEHINVINPKYDIKIKEINSSKNWPKNKILSISTKNVYPNYIKQIDIVNIKKKEINIWNQSHI